MIELRPYQSRSIREIWAWFRENKTGNPLAILPTGAGKSIICAKLIEEAISFKSDKTIRVLVVTHSKELVEQNYEKFVAIAPAVDVGVYSAGLKRKDTDNQVIFASVQSIFNKNTVGAFDLMIVDECHLIPKSGDGRYRKLISRLSESNPKLRVIGLTATPYRLGCGYLYEGKGKIFDSVATEVTLNELLDLGFLSPIISRRPRKSVDLKGVKKVAGEFVLSQLAERMMDDNLTEIAIDDVLTQSDGRRSWLFFCSSILHAEKTAEYLTEKGVRCAVISGNTPARERDKLIAEFKSLKLTCLVNCEVLTTGFDAPSTDLIVMLRPTESTALYQQMAGRGMRIAEGKTDCLLLDYAGNVLRHGCLDDPHLNFPKQGGGKGIAPTKYCPQCDVALPASLRVCSECGHEFPISQVKLAEIASEHAVLSRDKQPILKLYHISRITYVLHKKEGSKDSVRATYFGYRDGTTELLSLFAKEIVSEWICVEHTGYPKTKAIEWWDRWVQADMPEKATDAVALLKANKHSKPNKLIVDTAGKYPEIKALIEER
ncbi:TPA: DEAD/DEAH box helicase family protein [Vibrio harveyi]